MIYSRWAEVEYFLLSNGDVTSTNTNGTSLQLYSLRRRIRVLAPAGVNYDNVPQSVASNTIAQYPELALAVLGPGSTPNTVVLRVLGPEDVVNPSLRIPYQSPITKNGSQTGDDILLTDVLSFEVKAAWLDNPLFNNPNTGGTQGSSPAAGAMAQPTNNTDAPFDNIPPTYLNTRVPAPQPRFFDTWYKSPNSDQIDWDKPSNANGGFLMPNTEQPPLRINVRSIQIRLRVYDRKAEQARQVTMIQEI